MQFYCEISPAGESKTIFNTFVLSKRISVFNVSGMMLACLGVLCYNRAKVQLRKSTPLLPYSSVRTA